MKYFIITIDTEGDNLWRPGQYEITTKNTQYLKRFQDLCEKHQLIPTWLTNYEMIMDDEYVSYIKPKVDQKLCEIGMHLHAWNSPPEYELKNQYSDKDHPFLIQYPEEVMRDKITYLTELIEERIGVKPTSHRAGRWIINQQYLSILAELGYTVDSSVTPHINWIKTVKDPNAVDYTDENEMSNMVTLPKGQRIMEVPVTTRIRHKFHALDRGLSMKQRLKSVLQFAKGSVCWMRPLPNCMDDMKQLLRSSMNEKGDCIVFMMHSSEFMPGGSPYFPGEENVEQLFAYLDSFFGQVCKCCKGISLSDYATLKERGISR